MTDSINHPEKEQQDRNPASADFRTSILAAADLLGVKGTTLLAVRPDGYIGMRSDRDHLNALERYRTLVRAGHA